MNVHNLPNDIFPARKGKQDRIIFHYYSALTGSFKGKSILHRNAISLVIQGEKSMQFANRTVNIKDDEFHFLSAGNCLASVSLSERKVFSSILIFFDNQALADFYLKYDSFISKVRGKKKVVSESYVSFKKDAWILHYINSLKLLFQATAEISTEMRILKFEELMVYLVEKYPEKILSFQTSEVHELNDLEVRKAVEANISNNITLEELAFLCNISLSTFKRRFVKIYGSSPNKWMLQRRMEMAKTLLLHHHEKPSEVFHKVGYENHSSFTQSFKQTFGMTPKAFQLRQLAVQQ